MNNILQEMIKEGALVEPKAAEKISGLDESEQADVLERVRREKPLVVGEEFFQNVIDVLEIQEPKKTSMQESATRLNAYFNSLQALFEKKNRAVSISNASGNASVIGLVKNVLPDGFELEDQTGEIKITSKTQVEEDDVAMVSGKVSGKNIYADYVEFPDLPEAPLRKSPKNCEVVFSAKQTEGGDYSISFGDRAEIAKNSLVVGKLPVQVRINNILVLAHNGGNGAKNISPLQILKKRRLLGTMFAIADAPDILLLRGAENFFENYKGTSIVAINDKSVARINLKTREVKFEELSGQKT